MDQQQADQIIAEAESLIATRQFRNLVAQSHSRSVLRRFGTDTAQWPNYTSTLDQNLLYAAHMLFWQGLKLRDTTDFHSRGNELIKQGSEILEFLYSEMDLNAPDCLENLFNAALGYYISGYYARSYVMMRELSLNTISSLSSDSNQQLPPEFELLRRLFLKDLSGLKQLTLDVVRSDQYSDVSISTGLRSNNLSEESALDQILRASLNRSISFFLEFPKSGRREYIDRAIELASQAASLALKVRFVNWWWLFYCARHIFNEFDTSSFWTQLNPLLDNGNRPFVEQYIRSNYRRKPTVMELWPSQRIAFPRIREVERKSYCIKMPTSAGKTRIAELAILQFLLDYKDDPEAKCVYLAPFRSLAVEVETSLRQSFQSLGIRVSELYGGFELSPVERILMKQTKVIVATPEKIDAFIRYTPEIAANIHLIILDEGHMINPSERGVRFEFFIQRLVKRFENATTRFLFISAVLPNVSEFALWITGNSENIIESDWRPSRLMLGELRWNGLQTSIYYTHVGHESIEHECYVSGFIKTLAKDQLKGTRRRNPFPNDLHEVIADAALRFAQQDMTLVFVAQKRSVKAFADMLLKVIKLKNTLAKKSGETFELEIESEGQQLLQECISTAQETMGNDADFIEYLKAGFVIHHGDLPSRLRIKVEQLVRRQIVKLVVATTTLAQGVNMPIRTVIVHSLLHNRNQLVSPLDFWNICGRAGRAMKEKEGQVLFAVHLANEDPTLRIDQSRKGRDACRNAIRQQQTQRGYRQQLVDGYKTYKLKSGIAQLLEEVISQWRHSHPTANVFELCQLLADNDLSWLQAETARPIEELLDFLDAQIMALTEEQSKDEFTPDDLQELIQRSLMALQLETEPAGELTAELATNILYARLTSIHKRVPDRLKRLTFYQLGFPLTDCQKVEDAKDTLLELYLSAVSYLEWSVNERINFFVKILSLIFQLNELSPSNSSMSNHLKETWEHCWEAALELWLQGYTPNEIAKDQRIAEITTSPAEISILIDSLFGYLGPWGVNAITVYLQSVTVGTEDSIPEVANYFSALLKYGVHIPAASTLMVFGLDARKLALRLAKTCPNELMEPETLLNWFNEITEEDLIEASFNQDEISAILGVQQEAQNVRDPQLRRTKQWSLEVPVGEESYRDLRVGDALTIMLDDQMDESRITVYTIWGEFLGDHIFKGKVPEIWFVPDSIVVTIATLNQQSTISVIIEEV